MPKWPVQKLAQGTTQKVLQHHDATDIKKTYIFVLSHMERHYIIHDFDRNNARKIE